MYVQHFQKVIEHCIFRNHSSETISCLSFLYNILLAQNFILKWYFNNTRKIMREKDMIRRFFRTHTRDSPMPLHLATSKILKFPHIAVRTWDAYGDSNQKSFESISHILCSVKVYFQDILTKYVALVFVQYEQRPDLNCPKKETQNWFWCLTVIYSQEQAKQSRQK